MIYPSIDEITKGKYNRYTLCIATAKCARIVTDEYVEQRELAEKMLANKETDKSLASMIKREIRDDKAVKTAIKRLYNGDFVIHEASNEPPVIEKKMTEGFIAYTDEVFHDEDAMMEESEEEENEDEGMAAEESEDDYVMDGADILLHTAEDDE